MILYPQNQNKFIINSFDFFSLFCCFDSLSIVWFQSMYNKPKSDTFQHLYYTSSLFLQQIKLEIIFFRSIDRLFFWKVDTPIYRLPYKYLNFKRLFFFQIFQNWKNVVSLGVYNFNNEWKYSFIFKTKWMREFKFCVRLCTGRSYGKSMAVFNPTSLNCAKLTCAITGHPENLSEARYRFKQESSIIYFKFESSYIGVKIMQHISACDVPHFFTLMNF